VTFGADYAAAYDDLYGDKDYAAECDLLVGIFDHYGRVPVNRVLDLGCGTGNHAVPLAQRGYTVVGVDSSAAMLDRARARGSAATFYESDLRHADLGQKFDAVVMMFAVLGYQTRNADVQAALTAARRHLDAGGVLFADVWYGPAVLQQRPSQRVKTIDLPDSGQVIRVAGGELQVVSNTCVVNYHVWRIENKRICAEVREHHEMRYFFGPELDLFLTTTGFELVRVGAFPDFDNEPSEQTWNVAFLARAR
jgi:SAM-dependent methyltransferase